MDKGDKLPSERLRASRSGTTTLKRYEEMLVTSMLGTSHANEPLQAVVENQLHPTALKETNNSILERNRALLQYVATIANSNKRSDKFNYEFVESLVNGGADINTTDQYGQSIFHEVARCWDCDVAKFLLDLDCDINKQDSYGRAPLHVAASVDYFEMTQFLLINNADINVRTYGENQAPLHYAAKNGATKSLRVLLGFNADINSMDAKRRTPLQLAAEWTRGNTAEVLLEEGCASCLLDTSGNSALNVLIDRLPNLALEALNQLHSTDIITMKEFYHIQYLEQPLTTEIHGECEMTDSKIPPPANFDQKNTLGTPKKVANGVKNGKIPSFSSKENEPLTIKSPARSPLENAVVGQKFEVVTHPVMQRLIHNKWLLYGRLSTIFDLLFHVVYGTLWTICCITIPDNGKQLYDINYRTWTKVMSIIVGLMTCYNIIFQIRETIKARKSQKTWIEWKIAQLEAEKQYCHPRWPQEEKYINLEIKRAKSLPLMSSFGAWFYLDWFLIASILLTVITGAVYHKEDNTATRYLFTRTISVVNLIVWLRLLKYVRPFQGIGTLVIVLGETLADFVNWAFLFLLLLVPFMAAFWINFGSVSIHPVKGYDEGNHLLHTVFRMAVGDEFNLKGIVSADPVMARILVVLFLTAMTIVTLNLLIALLTDTFSRVYGNAVANTIMQRAIKVVNAKKTLLKKQKIKYKEYMRNYCSPEVIDMYVQERISTTDEQIARNEVQSQLSHLNDLLFDRFGKAYGKDNSSDFDCLCQDVKQLHFLQREVAKDLSRIQELLSKYAGNSNLKVTFDKLARRRKKEEKPPLKKSEEKEESKGILFTIQERAISFFARFTADSDEEKRAATSKNEEKRGRRRRKTEDSEDERSERIRRRRRRRQRRSRDRVNNNDDTEPLYRERRSRRAVFTSEGSLDSENAQSTRATVHYDSRNGTSSRDGNDHVNLGFSL